jgi:hypothetical protein
VNCPYCSEPLLPDEPVTDFARQWHHRECAVRQIAGSAAHQLGECSCYGGTREDPPQMTLRQAAQLAYDTFLVLRKRG